MSFVKKVKDIQYESTREGFLFGLSRRESSSDMSKADNVAPNVVAQSIHNRPPSSGYIGYFQVGEAALYDAGYFNVPYEFSNSASSDFQVALRVNDWVGSWTGKDGVTSKAIFLSGRTHQLAAINSLIQSHCNRLRNLNVNEFYGKVVNGVDITESGCVAGSHLRGAKYVLEFVRGISDEADAFDTKVSEYIDLFAHYNLETCCNRKIQIKVVTATKQPVAGKSVTVESDYPEGKYYSEVGKITNTFTSDESGLIPIIVRHPGAKITITVDGVKHEGLVQNANNKQELEVVVSDQVSVRSVLEKPAAPQPKPEVNQTPQDARNVQNAAQAEQQPAPAKKDVQFSVKIIEGDTQRALSSMRFYLTYKGNLKEHRSDNSGVKSGIVAEVGQDVEVAVAGQDGHQAIHHFKVEANMDGKVVNVPLPVHRFKLKVIDEQQQPVKNANFMIFYRGRQIAKKTDAQGMISLNMLTGFVYGFGLINGKKLVDVRCQKTIGEQRVKLNAAAQQASRLLDQLAVAKPAVKPASPVTQPPPAPPSPTPPNAAKQPAQVQQNNTHTQTNGNPVTTVTQPAGATSDTTRYHIYHNGTIKRENRAATGHAEFIYYDKNGGQHNLGKSPFIVAPKRGPNNVAIGGSSYLIDQRLHASYQSGAIGFKLKIISDSSRYYLNGVTLAAVLGTLMSLPYEEYVGSGWSNREGKSMGGSKTHRNGEAGDFRYLGSNDEHRTQAVWANHACFDVDENTTLVERFRTFGFNTFYTQEAQGVAREKIANTKYIVNHYHHLHIGGHSYAVEDI